MRISLVRGMNQDRKEPGRPPSAVSPARDLRVVRRELDELGELASRHEPDELRALLSRLVPSYPGGRVEHPVDSRQPARLFDRAQEQITGFATPPIPLTVGK